jgi:hypothetical protein
MTCAALVLPLLFTDSSTLPQVSNVKICARIQISGNGFDSARGFVQAEAKTVKMASSACGDAVANGVSQLCTGSDPMTTIYSMAQTCASAVAEVYAKSVSGAQVGSGAAFAKQYGLVANTYKASQYRMVCADSCATASATSQAIAQAAACGVAAATDNCAAAGAYTSTKSFSKAFVKAIANSWASACAKGVGQAQAQGEVVASVSAQSIAKAMAQAAATACTSCPICKCKDLPPTFSWNDVSQVAEASAETTQVCWPSLTGRRHTVGCHSMAAQL